MNWLTWSFFGKTNVAENKMVIFGKTKVAENKRVTKMTSLFNFVFLV